MKNYLVFQFGENQGSELYNLQQKRSTELLTHVKAQTK